MTSIAAFVFMSSLPTAAYVVAALFLGSGALHWRSAYPAVGPIVGCACGHIVGALLGEMIVQDQLMWPAAIVVLAVYVVMHFVIAYCR
ncbi:hypothetical protein HYS28_01420 [Candidatus Uhrbacteria bacterium]|nr:hypothetical protein [Candidatus Uhrbacteria bacterium]